MRTLYVILLIHASLELQCSEKQITAHIGGEFLLTCNYDTNHFKYSKKYWCRGDLRNTCEILCDSERNVKTKDKYHITDGQRRGLFVKVTDLRWEDAGVYWVGIDKIYADIMTSVRVRIIQDPVSKPRLWPLTSLVDRPTCRGKPVTVRCGHEKGIGIRYSWFRYTRHEEFVFIHQLPDLSLHCGTTEENTVFFCTISNDVSSDLSDNMSVNVLRHSNSSCVYVISIPGQTMYDCADIMSVTTVKTPKITSDITIQPSQANQTDQEQPLSRSWKEMPHWYNFLRWGYFASLLIFLGLVQCTCRRKKKEGNQVLRKKCRIVKT